MRISHGRPGSYGATAARSRSARFAPSSIASRARAGVSWRALNRPSPRFTETVVNPVPTTATEAPAGFDNLTNGYTQQGPDFSTIDDETVVALRSHNDNRFIFEEFETVEDGVGPTYNANAPSLNTA